MKEPAHQSHAILGGAVEPGHRLARQVLRLYAGLGARQPIIQVPQQKHRVPGLQPQALLLLINMQPAMTLHDQVEARPRQAVGAGVPAAAITAHMEQARIQFEAF